MSKYVKQALRVAGVGGTGFFTYTYISYKQKYEDFKNSLQSYAFLPDVIKRWRHRSAIADDEKLVFSSGLPNLLLEKVSQSYVAESATHSVVENFGSLDVEQLRERLEQVHQEIIEIQRKHKHELKRLEAENEALKKELTLMNLHEKSQRRIRHKSVVELYGEVLDTLSEFDKTLGPKDTLPRVVVVGDQSAGKTSVLEFIAKARIFPRGSGEMMTRAPIMVTMGEGSEHIAMFRNSKREYKLNSESELSELRNEIERRMKENIKPGKTISNEVISLSLSGPGISRMVLVDLPGIINTVTSDMSLDAKDSIIALARSYMSNPNSIILCVQDGSVDAERSLVTDLVSSIDPNGSRTICVLTKIDVAEQNNVRIDRLQKLLNGKLFLMKALSYFAVVAGTGNPNSTIDEITTYEEEFFKNSSLFKDGIIKPSQATSQNLIYAVTQSFWEMVRTSVEREADALRSRQFALDAEWRHSFHNMRELDRDELFEKAKADILDDALTFCNTSPMEWEASLSRSLWDNIVPFVFQDIYLPNALTSTKVGFQTQVEIFLDRWIDNNMCLQSIEIAKQAMLDKLCETFTAPHVQYEGNTYKELFKPIRDKLLEYCKKDFQWSEHNIRRLRIIQQAALGDGSVSDRSDWDQACAFMEGVINEDHARLQGELYDMVGPSGAVQWLYWSSTTPEQVINRSAVQELTKLLSHREQPNVYKLSSTELATAIQGLQNEGVAIKRETLLKIWDCLYLSRFYTQVIDGIHECKKSFRNRDFSNHVFGCNDVLLFYKVHRLLHHTVNALRQQIYSQEARRLENFLRDVLEDISVNPQQKVELFQGRQVELANEIKKVASVKESLDRFIEALNREKDI